MACRFAVWISEENTATRGPSNLNTHIWHRTEPEACWSGALRHSLPSRAKDTRTRSMLHAEIPKAAAKEKPSADNAMTINEQVS